MDTVPYWYEPFGRIYGLSGDTVAELAEPWITGVLGYRDHLALPDSNDTRRYEWHEFANDHGSQARVEDLQTYFEYHALQLLAGELVDNGTPIHVDRDDRDDPWEGWLAEHLPVGENGWLAEWREPPGETARTLSPITVPASRRDEVRLDGWYIIDGSRTDAGDDRNRTIYFRSAIVSRRTSRALGRLLMREERRFELPHRGEADNLFADKVDSIDQFNLVGWVPSETWNGAGLEEWDGRRRIAYGLKALPPEFVAHSRGTLSTNGTALEVAGVPVMRRKRWSDQPVKPRDADRASYVEGDLLLVQPDALTEFLRELDMDLLITIRTLTYQRERAAKKEQEPENDPKLAAFRLTPAGRLESIT